MNLKTGLERENAPYLAEILDALISRIPSGVVILDADFRILQANRNFFDQLHLKHQPIRSKSIFDILPHVLLAEGNLAHVLARVKRTCKPIKVTNIGYNLGSGSVKILNVMIQSMGEGGADGFLMVWDDVSDRVEKIFELSMLRRINELTMEENLRLDRLLHLILTCVTAGSALGFNRAFLLLMSKDGKRIRGKMGVGPYSREDAHRIWASLGTQRQTLRNFLDDVSYDPQPKDSPLAQIALKMNFSLTETHNVVVSAILNKKAISIANALRDSRVDENFRAIYTANEFVIVPMIGRNRVLGAIIADNLYSHDPIREEQVQLLTLFANQAGLAIETTQMYRNLQRDHSRLQQAYEALKNTQEKLVNMEKLAAIGRMAALVSHEIRNPLVTIGGFAHTILKSERPSDVCHAADVIASEVNRLEKILDRVLDFSKPIKPDFKPYAVNAVVRESIELVREELKTRQIKLTVRLDEALPQIVIDPEQLKQAVLNILKNAIYAMPIGGVLSARTVLTNERVRIEIADTGGGIPRSVMQHLFTPFFTTRSSGSGLGLAATQQIVEQHQGTIDIRSEEGKGTTCVISLPRKKEPLQTNRCTKSPAVWVPEEAIH